MDKFDIPIFKKSYDLYKTLYAYRLAVPKQDRYTLWQKCEQTILDIVEGILLASQEPKNTKCSTLEQVSLKLNMARVFFRLAKEVKAIDNKKYVVLQTNVDEIGRMLGGWIKSAKE